MFGVLGQGWPFVADIGMRGSVRRDERPEQPTLACTRTAAHMLERPARALGQTAPLALLVAEPTQAGIRAARQSTVGDLVDPLRGSALRRRVAGSRPREHRHRGQRKWKRAHLAPQHLGSALSKFSGSHGLLSGPTMTANWGVARMRFAGRSTRQAFTQSRRGWRGCVSHFSIGSAVVSQPSLVTL